jgi:HK97 family phage portal protein
MGLLTNKLGIRALSMEDPSQPLLPYSALFESLGLGKSDAGVMVNEKQAMRLTTAYACIMIISADLSSLPLPIYQRMPDGSSREAFEHPYYKMLHDAPNDWMTSMVFRGALIAAALGWGNGYAVIRRDRGARANSLALLPPDKTSAVMIDGKLMYGTTATADGLVSYIDPANMLHPSGLSIDGFTGLSPIGTCKNAFGLAIAAEKFGARFFGNGARASGVLSHPGQLDTEAQENLKKSVNEVLTGENSMRPLVLEEGMTWTQMTVAPNDAQFLETRKFQRSEIAALFRVPLHLLQDLERSTNNNIEHQSLDYIRYTLRPWAVRLEQEINRKLLGGDFYCEHDMNAFQRGDFASQTAGFTLLRNAGVYSANDILRALRQNPIPAADGGDIRLAPLNMVPLTTLAGEAGAVPDDTTDSDRGTPITDMRRERIVNAYRRLFRDAVGRVVNRKNADTQFAYRAFQPILGSMGEAVLAMHLPGATKLSDEQESAISAHASGIAAECSAWTAANASATATTLTNDAYTALETALIG